MATMSAETQAIIDRLKAEGDLMRNSGTNSLKSVKVELGKFNDLFGVISKNIEAQTEALGLQAKIQADQLEAQRTKEQFEELQQQKREEKEKKQETNDGEDKAFKAIDKIGDAISNSFSLKNIAMAAGGIFVGYNLLKGYINESTDGGFDRMIDSIKNINWQEMGTTFNNAVTGIGQVDFSGLANTVNSMTTSMANIKWDNVSSAVNTMATRIGEFNAWLGETGVGDIVTAVAAGGLVTAGARGAAGGIFDALRGQGQTNLRKGLTSIPRGIAGVTAGLAIYYGDEIKGWLNSQMGNEEGGQGEQTINTLVNTVTAAGTLLSIFGLGPLGIGAAAIAVGVGLGVMIRDWVQNRKEIETQRFNEQVDAALAAAEAEEDPTQLSDEAKANLGLAFVEARRRTQLAIGEAAVAEAERAQAEIAEVLAQQQLPSDGGGASGRQIEETVRAAMEGDQGAIDELFAFAQAREAERGWFSRKFGGTTEEWIRDFILSSGSYLGTAVNDQMNGRLTKEQYDTMFAERERFDQIAEQILQERGFRRGTGGFKDFGAGTVSILHGKEAVVPLNSPEGQILNNLYNGRSPADVISGNATGMGGAITIVDGTTNVSAPVMVNDAGSSASVTNIFGEQGRGGGYSVYGLPGAIG